MTEHMTESGAPRRWRMPMVPRSPHEVHRAATPLELFFDLVFVVAIAQAGLALHHGLAEVHIAHTLVGYTILFFGIWWAWMNFTWFASAYDCDDVPYRLAVFVQLIGALILAAGVERAFADYDFRITTTGYVVMRFAMVAQWLRAARSDPPRRAGAYRYAIGIAVCQVGWVLLLLAPTAWYPIGFSLWVFAEFLVPIWAERASTTPWHPGHIAERYGLFTIIVLGESILSASMAVQAVTEGASFNGDVITIIVGGLLIIFVMWWLYFYQPVGVLLTSTRKAFIWGYGHLLVFASAAAVGAGLAVEVDQALNHAEISRLGAGLAVAIPVAIYLTMIWLLHERPRAQSRLEQFLFPVTALLVLLTPWAGGKASLLAGLLLVALLTAKLVIHGTTTSHEAT